MSDPCSLYLELLKKTVGNFIYGGDLDLMLGTPTLDPPSGKVFSLNSPPADPAKKVAGGIWPSQAHTMIGLPRLENLQFCLETVLKEGVPGDLIETGVWRGGAGIFMAGFLKAHGISERKLWLADSFEGLPPPNFRRYPRESDMGLHLVKHLAVSLEEVRANFEKYGLLSEQINFLKGWFRETLPTAPIQTLALLRLDGDMYESTMDALVHLYPKLTPGGFIIVDDYNSFQPCNEALHDYRSLHQIQTELQLIPKGGAFWRKEA
ncbi:MAG: class I SAM-dependent methyltransferase [Candidatus Sericytochromatia bacterium]|nr:class I SAM-dependent methyltransferase [Candidatus Sericytochromatia bacterium]